MAIYIFSLIVARCYECILCAGGPVESSCTPCEFRNSVCVCVCVCVCMWCECVCVCHGPALLSHRLAGFPPFWHRKQLVMLRSIMEGKYEFVSPEWDEISDQAKDMVRAPSSRHNQLLYV